MLQAKKYSLMSVPHSVLSEYYSGQNVVDPILVDQQTDLMKSINCTK